MTYTVRFNTWGWKLKSKEIVVYKTLIILLVIVTMLFISACGSKPQTVARKFLTAMENGDADTMKKLSTPESHTLLGLIPMLVQQLGENPKFEILSTEVVDDDNATVKYKITGIEDAEEDDLKLVKRDGKWLVHFTAK